MVNYYTYLGMFLQNTNKEINLKEFEKQYGVPHQTIKPRLEKFVKARVLNKEKRDRFLFYSINKDNPLTREYLTICEKERLIEFLDKKPIMKRLYEELAKYFKDSSILLFGSSTNNEKYNDIDLLAITKNDAIKKTVKQFEQTYSKKIHLITTNEKNMTKRFKNELQKKHIILNNHDYFWKVLYNEY